MPILQGDIKLLKSERMTDNADGGGRITGNEIVDGLSNEIFNDVSDLDRTYGRTSLRKAFAAVHTDDTDYYFGSHIIIDQAPDDDNVSVLAFSTGSPVDERDGARERVEGYVVSGPLTRMRLYGDQLAGQRSILTYQRSGETPPDIGDVLLLATESGAQTGEQQYVRVTEVESNEQTFTDTEGDFTRQVLTIGISTPLDRRFYGHEPKRTTSEQPDSRVRSTLVADSSRYFGISKLALAASLGSNQLQVASVYQPIVPSTQTETPVVDVQIGGETAVRVTSGGIEHEIPQVAETTRIGVQINNRAYNYTRNLQPLPAPGTVVVEYRALGRWYTLRDEAGNGELTGAGTGQINYATGSVIVTLQALPDVDTDILFFWGSPIHYVDRAGYPVPEPTPAMRLALDHGGIEPGSVTATWVAGGTTVTATDDGNGNLTGAATGSMIYGWRDTVDGDRVGEMWLEFGDGNWPDANSDVVVDYTYGASESNTHTLSADGTGYVQITLPNAPIKPGSVSVEWSVLKISETNSGQENSFTLQRSSSYEGKRVTHEEMRYRAYDDGQGGFHEFTGTIDYATGAVTLQVEEVDTVKAFTRLEETGFRVGGTAPSTPGSATWGDKSVESTFPDASTVITRHQPDIPGADTGSVTRTPDALTVELIPLLQDQIVPSTLRFTFRGSTYLDRDGSLYRDVDPQTGAGLLSGSIDYQRGVIQLSDWNATGSDAVTVTSMVTLYGNWTVYGVTFRTPGAPVQVGGLTLLATTADGVLLNGQSQFNATIDGTAIQGVIDYTTGVASARFGEMVADASLTTEEKNEPWYDPSNVDGDGNIWKPREVLPSACRFNAVILSNLPLDAELLGLDPVRLPSDGRVPIYRPAQVAVVHNTASTPWPLGTVAGDTLDVGRTRLAFLRIEDANGTKLPEADYTPDLDAGTVQLSATADLTGYVEPLYAVHRIEDMVLIGDVQIGGELTIIGQLSHDYPADTTYVSSALIAGDLQARWTNLYDQTTWTNVWSDELIGDETVAEYNAILYPLTVTNRGTITERWALIFTGATTFRVVGESVGEIMTGTTAEALAPVNPNTGVPYFTLEAAGWGSGWSAGNVLRFNTVGASAPLWLARTVLQGPAESPDFQFRLQVRGNVNADPA